MPAASDAPAVRIRLASWNLGHRTREKTIPLDFYRAVDALRPDVLVLNEFKDGPSRLELRQKLRDQGLAHVLASVGRDGHNQVLVASRSPIVPCDLASPQAPDSHAHTNFMAVRHPASGLTIVGMRAPAYQRRPDTQVYWHTIGEILRASKGPLVLAGDFNIDPLSARTVPVFTQLKARGWQLPRPVGPWSFVSGSKIDHVLASPSIEIDSCQYVCEIGGIVLSAIQPGARISDHAALVAELQVVTPAADEDATTMRDSVTVGLSAWAPDRAESGGSAYASVGSQRWLQMTVAEAPALLDAALVEAGALDPGERVEWRSPIAATSFEEYRDGGVLRLFGIDTTELARTLKDFWPNGGPMWDGLGVTSAGRLILLEAKAHIPEAASPASRACRGSLERIDRALAEARAYYAPRSTAVWSGPLYQYANRLAFQYFFSVLNGLNSRLVFLDFCNAHDVGGPRSADEWRGATEMIHALLGLPSDLRRHGVHHAYVDVQQLPEFSRSAEGE